MSTVGVFVCVKAGMKDSLSSIMCDIYIYTYVYM